MNNSNENVMYDIRGNKILIRGFKNLIVSLIFMMNIMKLVFKDIINSRSKFSKKSSVIEEELSALLRDSKNHIPVRIIDNIF